MGKSARTKQGGQEVERYAVGDRASSRAGERCAVDGGAN